MRLTLNGRINLLLGFIMICAATLLISAVLPAAAQSDQAEAVRRAEEPKPPENCPAPFAQVDVTVDPESEPLLVDPESVEIYLPGGNGRANLVCWKVTGLVDGQTLHIQGKEGQSDLFPNLQRTIVAPEDTASSGQPSATGTWTYSLWITQTGSDEKLHFTDPEVIVGGDSDED